MEIIFFGFQKQDQIRPLKTKQVQPVGKPAGTTLELVCYPSWETQFMNSQ